MASFISKGGSKGQGKQGKSNLQATRDSYETRLKEIKATTNGRWNWDSSESAKVITEWPKLTCVEEGKAGMMFLPKQPMERLDLLLPHLMLLAPDAEFALFLNHLATHAAKAGQTTTHDEIWAASGNPLALPAPNERDVRDAELRVEITDLRKALTDLVKIQTESHKNQSAQPMTDAPVFPTAPSSSADPLSGSPSTKGSRANSPGARIAQPATNSSAASSRRGSDVRKTRVTTTKTQIQ